MKRITVFICLLASVFVASPAFPQQEVDQLLIARDVVSYSDFGAKGDGITDDVNAIAAAHAYANLRRELVVRTSM